MKVFKGVFELKNSFKILILFEMNVKVLVFEFVQLKLLVEIFGKKKNIIFKIIQQKKGDEIGVRGVLI